jgi:pyruvate,water dikinase
MTPEEKKKALVIWFQDLRIEDVPLVGGKNAALGEMYANLAPLGVRIPNGFALTATAYRAFFSQTGLEAEVKRILADLNTKNLKNLQARGKAVREAILAAKLPRELDEVITKAYMELEKLYGKNADVAVRSSATAEDLPGASFAGQQETYLNIRGVNDLLIATKRCIASLFTDRAISYRTDKGFSHFDVALSVGVQKMVRSDLASSGVMFTIDTESGFDKVIVINGIYGLGEYIVQGIVVPDEFVVWKPGLEQGHRPIIEQNLGDKKVKLIYGDPKKPMKHDLTGGGVKKVTVSPKEHAMFCITEDEVLTLAQWALHIEKYFSKKHNRYQPMDIEWAKDGKTNELFIVQARPETVQALRDKNIYREYHLKAGTTTSAPLVEGIAVGAKIGAGSVRVIKDAKKIGEFKEGEVLVTEITDPDWEPIMKIASAIVTDKGGRTSHAAIVSRELGIPCIVGSEVATKVLKNGVDVTVDCASGEVGKVYKGIIPFDTIEHRLDSMPETRTKIMVNIGSPDEAFKMHFLPAKGVGLGRLEFIIASHIRIHPKALIDYPNLKKDPKARRLVAEIDRLTEGYDDKARYYVDELAEGIGKIAAAFHPYDVIIRLSDFKTNEYVKLLGGERYEPHEENPMIGWRGASRYYDPKFADAFGLEIKALKKVREDFGLTNVIPMVPFCRTPEEGAKVVKVMAEHGLDRTTDETLRIYVMCEIPSNILLADKFLDIFDGMSIGSNDLTQLTLGLDRDSGIVTHIANEHNAAVEILITDIVKKCNAKKKYIGICGQAPSDYPDFAEFLVGLGIQSMSLNPDTVIKTLLLVSEKEKKQR